MAGITKRGDKWLVRWRDPDGSQRGRSFDTAKAAKAHAIEVSEHTAPGVRWEPRDARPAPRLGDVARDWLTDAARNYAPGTLTQHAHRLDLWLRWLQDREGVRTKLWPSLLTYQMLSAFHAELDGFEGKGRTESTRNKYDATVQLLWRWAWEQDYEVPRVKSLRLRAPVRALTQAPTWAECDTMIACLEGVNTWAHVLAVLCRYAGLRDGQADLIEWRDVDLEACTLTVRGELGKTRAEQQGRRLPISLHLVEFLSGPGRREGFVVPLGERTERIVRQRVLRRAWERAGVAPEPWRGQPGHALRKAFISELERAGVGEAAVDYSVRHGQRIRGVYVPPEALGLDKVASAVARIGSGSERVRAVSKLDERRRQSGSAKG